MGSDVDVPDFCRNVGMHAACWHGMLRAVRSRLSEVRHARRGGWRVVDLLVAEGVALLLMDPEGGGGLALQEAEVQRAPSDRDEDHRTEPFHVW